MWALGHRAVRLSGFRGLLIVVSAPFSPLFDWFGFGVLQLELSVHAAPNVVDHFGERYLRCQSDPNVMIRLQMKELRKLHA